MAVCFGEIMIDLNCDMGQGYLFARPMSAADWLQWMRDRQGARAAMLRES